VEDAAGYAAKKVCQGNLVGWFQGRMEVGARALGGRSILADPRDASVKDRINKYVKFREDFRPFAPSVLESESPEYFDFGQASPFMSFVAPVLVPTKLPGITHVDGTARLHTVPVDESPYSRLLQAMHTEAGYACVLNTSFNYMGQPIVCTPKEAIYTFFGTGLDVLVLGNWVVEKSHVRS
jgi:carbamoyltransferase